MVQQKPDDLSSILGNHMKMEGINQFSMLFSELHKHDGGLFSHTYMHTLIINLQATDGKCVIPSLEPNR